MRTMTCAQLGGACDAKFTADSFEEISALSKKHAMIMFRSGDEAHIKAMNDMGELMNKPGAMNDWYEEKKKEYYSMPEVM